MVLSQFTMVKKGFDLGTGTSSQRLESLPNGAAISRIWFREIATHATSIAITVALVEVTVNGSVVISMSGEDLRKITKVDSGHIFATPGTGASSTAEGVIHFGRFPRDTRFCLPAGLFQNVQLRVNATTSATPVSWQLDVAVEELLGVDLTKTVMRKRVLINDYAAGTSLQTDTDLSRGNPFGALYIDGNDVDNLDGDNVKLGINNFTRVLFDASRSSLEALNIQSYAYDDGAIPATAFVVLDADIIGNPGNGIPTAGFSKFTLRTKSASSGTSGNVRVIQEEWVPLSKDSLPELA